MTRWITSLIARMAVTLILISVAVIVAFARSLRWLFGLEPRSLRENADKISGRHVVMVGTFYNEGWFRSHIAPLTRCEEISGVTVICDKPLLEVSKVAYVSPPSWLKRILGRTLARTISTFTFSLRNKPAVLIGYHIMPNALICLVVARLLGLKAIYQMTGGPIQIQGGGVGSENTLLRKQIVPSLLREGLMFHIVRQFDRVIVRGTQAHEFLTQLGIAEKADIIPGSIDTSEFAPSTERRVYDLVAVGRLVDVKRYDRMLQIIEALARNWPDIRIAIIGDGPLRGTLEQQAAALGISSNVSFLGQRDDVRTILNQSRAFILTSENEGLSIAMMEAMAAGLPAFSSDVGEHRDLIRPGQTGLLIDPTQPSEAAAMIAAYFDQPAELERTGRDARLAVTAHADIRTVADNWATTFRHMFRPVPSDAGAAKEITPITTESRKLRRTAWAVFGLALAIRAVFCFGLVMGLKLPMGPNQEDFYDSTDGYINIAQNIADVGSYSFQLDSGATTYRAPIYPFVLAVAYRLTNDIASAVLWVNCIASSLSCVLIYLLAVRLLKRPINLWMMLPVILFPLSVYYCVSSFSDTFVTFTTLLFVVATLSLFTLPTIRRAILTALSFAAAVLTKSTVLPIPLLLCAYALFRRRAALKHVVIATVAGFALTSLWTIRNYNISDHFIPVTGGTGYNTLIGNFMLERGDDCDKSLAHGRAEARKRVLADTGRDITTKQLRPAGFLDVPNEIDNLYMHSAQKMFAESPLLLIKKLSVNFARFWYFSSSLTKSLANAVMNLAVLLFALIALRRIWRDAPTATEALGIILASIVFLYAVIIVHSSRFCLPVVMPLIPVATVGVIECWKSIRTRFAAATSHSQRVASRSHSIEEGAAPAWKLELSSKK